MRSLPVFPDLRAYLGWCEAQGELARIAEPVSIRHEMTAVQLACLRRGGPALEFSRHDGPGMRVVSNLFGTPARVAAGLGLTPDKVPEFGAFLAALRSQGLSITIRAASLAKIRAAPLAVCLTARCHFQRPKPLGQLRHLSLLPLEERLRKQELQRQTRPIRQLPAPAPHQRSRPLLPRQLHPAQGFVQQQGLRLRLLLHRFLGYFVSQHRQQLLYPSFLHHHLTQNTAQ